MKSIMQPLYNFVRFICHIFEKCQNLGSNDENIMQLLNNYVNFAICALQLP